MKQALLVLLGALLYAAGVLLSCRKKTGKGGIFRNDIRDILGEGKNVSLREKSRLTTMIMLAGAALGTIGAYINLTVTLLGVALLFGGLWLHLRWYRCPHCGASLGRNGIPKYCPGCGEAIDADRKEP